MTGGLASLVRRGEWSVPGWAAAVLVLLVTAALGQATGSLARPVFVIGCGVAGWYAWRQSAGAHLQAALVLFAFAPFVRRLVDVSAGYDQAGLMLVGPLLAILVPVPTLLRVLDSERPLRPQMGPLILVGGCTIYAATLSMVQADWMNAATGTLKWLAPLLYAAVLVEKADRDEMIQAAASAFLVILPIIGLYGIVQYVDPPAWDRYWMSFAPIMSAGYPVPYGVRTFSTMNGPASFATFTAIGLMLVFFLRPGWQSLLLTGPATLALFLSLYRTAWLSLGLGVLFCILFTPTRTRAATILLGILGAGVVAATLTPFGDVIGDRLATLGEGSQDGSAQERLEQFVTLWHQWDSSLFGVGFTVTDVGSAGAMAADGMIIACWLSMGIVVGLLCLFGLVWAMWQAVTAAWRDRRTEAVIVGALACGALIQLPLANITSGENGFLFWTFVVLTTQAYRRPAGVW